jgi:hypothetical protein
MEKYLICRCMRDDRNQGPSSTILRANSFLLSMCSPVLHKMLCGNFIESSGRKLAFKDVDGTSFARAMDMWCGKKTEIGLDGARELASVADRLQMTELVSALDEMVMNHLQQQEVVNRDVLNLLDWCGEHGLSQSEEAARNLATERFEELAKTEDFVRIGEDALARLLDDDALAARSEEAGSGGVEDGAGRRAGARARAGGEDPVSADGGGVPADSGGGDGSCRGGAVDGGRGGGGA